MNHVIEFLRQLRMNNNREWFEANKLWYKEVQTEFNGFVERLIAGIARFDSSIQGLTVKDCTYRIYRDTRFSPNKDPYKTHIGAYICRGGKKSGYAGYYFHIEPQGEGGLLGGNLMSAGLYMPEPDVLKSIRDEIFDNGAQVEAAVKQARGFRIAENNKLKRVPKGFPPDSPYAEYLKLKDVYLEKFIDDDYLLQPSLAEKAAAEFKKTARFVELMNRAADFAYENR